jgi:hypothetical protein
LPKYLFRLPKAFGINLRLASGNDKTRLRLIAVIVRLSVFLALRQDLYIKTLSMVAQEDI